MGCETIPSSLPSFRYQKNERGRKDRRGNDQEGVGQTRYDRHIVGSKGLYNSALSAFNGWVTRAECDYEQWYHSACGAHQIRVDVTA